MRHRRLALTLAVCCVLLFAGLTCAPLMRRAGMSEDDIARVQGVAVDQLREVRDVSGSAVRQIIATVVAGVGTVLSAVLARLLTTERKVNRAVITGVEAAGAEKTKAAIEKAAVAAGVEDRLHRRVRRVTDSPA